MALAGVSAKPTVLGLNEDLAAGRTSSRALIETASGNSIRRAVAMYSDNWPMIDLSAAVLIGSTPVPSMQSYFKL